MPSATNLEFLGYRPRAMRVHRVHEEDHHWERVLDRRGRVRMPVHWTVYLSRKTDSHPFETVTRDMSSGGFYCLVPEPFLPGEPIDCRIVLPQSCSPRRNETICLHGVVKVVRLESLGAEGFGIACELDDYVIEPFPL